MQGYPFLFPFTWKLLGKQLKHCNIFFQFIHLILSIHKIFYNDVVPGLLFIECFVQNLLKLDLEAFQNRIDFLI